MYGIWIANTNHSTNVVVAVIITFSDAFIYKVNINTELYKEE